MSRKKKLLQACPIFREWERGVRGGHHQGESQVGLSSTFLPVFLIGKRCAKSRLVHSIARVGGRFKSVWEKSKGGIQRFLLTDSSSGRRA